MVINHLFPIAFFGKFHNKQPSYPMKKLYLLSPVLALLLLSSCLGYKELPG